MQMAKRKKQRLHSLCKCQNVREYACSDAASDKLLMNVFAGTLQATNC